MSVLIDPPRVLGVPRRDFDKAIRCDPCSYCPARYGGTIDHINPRAHGGDNTVLNIVSACRACNRAKGAGPSLLLFLLSRLEGTTF